MLEIALVKPGHHFKPIPALPLIEADEELLSFHNSLTVSGFKLNKSARGYRTKKGSVTLKFIWRRREAGLTACMHRVFRFKI